MDELPNMFLSVPKPIVDSQFVGDTSYKRERKKVRWSKSKSKIKSERAKAMERENQSPLGIVCF